MDAVEENLFNCIKYEEVVPTAPKFKLKITPFDSDKYERLFRIGARNDMCFLAA